MPVNPTYPGVYIEEISSGVHTIAGVATSIAAFFGRAQKGPIDKAVRCFNYSDFTRSFGSAFPGSDLAESIRLFFTNGGSECYVIRLAKNAKEATVTLKNWSNPRVAVLTAKAKMKGKWANTVRLEVDYNTINPDESFNLTVIHEEGGRVVQTEFYQNLTMNPASPRYAPDFITQSSGLISLEAATGLTTVVTAGFSQARRPLGENAAAVSGFLNGLIGAELYQFDINVNDKGYETVSFDGITFPNDLPAIQTTIKGKIEDAIRQRDPSLSVTCSIVDITGIGHILTITSDTDPHTSVRVQRASSNDIAGALMLGVGQGGIEIVRYCDLRPAPTGSCLNYGIVSDATNKLNLIGAMPQSEFKIITIDNTDITLTDGYSIVTTDSSHSWYQNNPTPLTKVNGHNDGIREKLWIIAKAITNNPDVPYRGEVWGYHLAIIPVKGDINTIPVSISTDANPPTELEDNIILNTKQYSLGSAGAPGFQSGTDGTDGDPPEKEHYLGNEIDHTGFHALDNVDIFNLMVLPADDEVDLSDIWGPASYYCEKKRAFLLIDAPPDWTDKITGLPVVVQETSRIGMLRGTVLNKNCAVFYPRLKYKLKGLIKLIGPAGAIAGLMARTDVARGVWKAPAGTDVDIRGIMGIEVKLTDPENGVLNKLAVNCIRAFPDSFVNWGARTMDGHDNNTDIDWRYIPIRRLALFIEESLFRGTKWVVFEPNDEPLWAKIRLNVGVFMNRLFRQGAFQGSTPDKAYYVKCDAETTTQDDRNRGIVNIEVGFAPLKPAEFVIIKIQQIAGELTV